MSEQASIPLEKFRKVCEEYDELEKQLAQVLALLKEFPGRYEDMLLYDHSLEDYYQRVTAFLESEGSRDE